MKNNKDDIWVNKAKSRNMKHNDNLDLTISFLRVWAIAMERKDKSQIGKQIADESMQCAKVYAEEEWGKGTKITPIGDQVEVENFDGKKALINMIDLRQLGFILGPKNLAIESKCHLVQS